MTRPTDAELENRFRYHKPHAVAIAMHAEVTEGTLALAKKLRDLMPPGRHADLALDHLCLVRMLANAAIACDYVAHDTTDIRL